MDPSVQVALVSVFTTLITTFGVVLVAVINSQRERIKELKAGVVSTAKANAVYTEETLDTVTERIFDLMSTIKQKEVTIIRLNRKIRRLTEENNELRALLNQENNEAYHESHEGSHEEH